MINKFADREFTSLIAPAMEIEEFQKTKDIAHHGITRYEHSMRVAYFSYKITKFLRLNYQETAEAALLHDFFLDEVADENGIKRLRRHPGVAVENASKYVDLTERQVDIIKTHMFPVTFTPPKYLESWIVDIVDDASAIYEKAYSVKSEVKAVSSFMFILLVSLIKIR